MSPVSSPTLSAAGCLLLFVASSSSWGNNIHQCQAFQVVGVPSRQSHMASQTQQQSRPISTFLSSSAGPEGAAPEEGSPSSSSSVDEEPISMEEESIPAEQVEEEEEEPQEDPEIKAIKDEIDVLESQLKDKRRTLAATNDKADEYTKTGYARKVAEMENMRRARSMLASSNKQGAVASTLTNFLPVFDRLQALGEENAEDDFGKQYGALYGSMQQAFADLGVADFSVNVGDEVDTLRMNVLESVHSETQPANTVLEFVAGGMELQGNIVRPAEVVASLGPEVVEEEAEDKAAPVEEGEAPEQGEA